jgi:hypothetical protein
MIQWGKNRGPGELTYLEHRQEYNRQMRAAVEKEKLKKLFLSPEGKREWITHYFQPQRTALQDFAIDSKTGIKYRNAKKVRELYLEEGTYFLKSKIEAPGPEEEKEVIYEPPPDLRNRPQSTSTKQH